MTNRRGILLGGVAASVFAGTGIGFAVYGSAEQALSEPPPREGSTLVLPPVDSEFVLRVDLPLDVLREAIAREVPSSLPFSGNGPNIVRGVGTRYAGMAMLGGPITVAADGDAILVSVPIAIQGNGGLRGDLARLVKADKKNFRVGVIVRLRAKVDLRTDWTPAVDVAFDYEWTTGAKVEIVGGVWVSLRSALEPTLRNHLGRLAQAVTAAIPDDLVKREMTKAWRVYSLPLSATPPLQGWAHVVPTAVATNGVTVAGDRVHIGVTLRAATEISTEPAPRVDLQPLPALGRVAATPGFVILSLPVHAGYDALGAALTAAIAGKKFAAAVPGGEASAIVNEVAVYPAGDKVAVGIRFAADLPGRLLNVAGSLYVVGRPTVDETGTTVALVDIQFSRQLDNPLWEIMSVLFQNQIQKAIEAGARVDLAPEIARAKQALAGALPDAERRGLKVTVRDIDARVEAVVPESDALAARVVLKAGVDTELTVPQTDARAETNQGDTAVTTR